MININNFQLKYKQHFKIELKHLRKATKKNLGSPKKIHWSWKNT